MLVTFQNFFAQLFQSHTTKLSFMSSKLQRLLAKSAEYQQASVAENSRNTYDSSVKQFKQFMESIGESPEPISAEKILGYVIHLKDDLNRTYATIRLHIAALSFYCRNTNQPDFTKDIRVKELKRGLLRVMNGNAAPKRKLPFLKENFIEMLRLKPPKTVEENRNYFLMSIMFFGFLRISEALALEKDDVTLDEHGQMVLNIRSSKTDQTGIGHTVYISDGGQEYSPFRFKDIILPRILVGHKIFPQAESTYRRRLESYFQAIHLDYKSYGFHSFRHGGAYAAACAGVEDSVIKTQGRWTSECFTIYVRVKPQRAGAEIGKTI